MQSKWVIFVPKQLAQLGAIAHLHPQRNLDGSDGFCLLSFFFFFSFFFLFSFYCYDLINFKIVFLSLYSDNLIILEFRDVWEKDYCVCSRCVCNCERKEKQGICVKKVRSGGKIFSHVFGLSYFPSSIKQWKTVFSFLFSSPYFPSSLFSSQPNTPLISKSWD